jgi:hypothetical protein
MALRMAVFLLCFNSLARMENSQMEFNITIPDEILPELEILAREANLFISGEQTDPTAIPDTEALIKHIVMAELKPKMVAAKLDMARSTAQREVNEQILKIKVKAS